MAKKGGRKSGARKPGAILGLGAKLEAWIEHNRSRAQDRAEFAKMAGLDYHSLSSWMKRGRRVPAFAIQKIAAVTGLPMDYWADDAIPYPPPDAWFEERRWVMGATSGLDVQGLRRLVALAGDPAELARLLEILERGPRR